MYYFIISFESPEPEKNISPIVKWKNEGSESLFSISQVKQHSQDIQTSNPQLLPALS